MIRSWTREFIAWSIVLTSATVASAKPTTIPLSSIITTSSQEGMLKVRDAFAGESEESAVGLRFYPRIMQETKTSASNVFLVEATSARYAFAGTANLLHGGLRADAPVNGHPGNTLDQNYWLVAYLGTAGSVPTRWIVENVKVDDGKITLSYFHPRTEDSTSDIHRYYYWVPLGNLAPKAYQVELFDTRLKAATLMRRVEVK